MQRKFLTNLGLILTLNLLVKPFFIFGIDRKVQVVVGAADYGFFFFVLNFSFLFNVLLDLGITNFNNRNIARNNQMLKKHFSGIFVMKLALALLYFLVTFIIAIAMKYKPEHFVMLGFLAFNQFLVSFTLYLRSNVSGLLYFKTDSILSVLDRLLMILFCGVLLWGHITTTTFRIEWFVYCQTAAYFITTLVALWVVIQKAGFPKLSWNWPFIVMIMKQSFPFTLLVLLMTLYSRLDSVMMVNLLKDYPGKREVGIYASGFRLLDAANMIAYLFAVLLIPIFSKMLKKKESVEKILKLAFTLIITFSIIITIGSVFYSYEMMDLLYKEHIEASSRVFRLLMGGFIAVSTSYIFGTLLTANGNLKQLNIISFIGLVINFMINLVLIPRLLAIGSAWASLVTQYFIAITQVILVQWIFRFRINYRFIFTLFLFLAGVILFNIMSRQLPIDRLGWISVKHGWFLSFSLMILLSFTFAAILKLFSIRSMLSILKEER